MNYYYFKMIRSSRLYFFGRKNYSVPLLAQRAALLPKQVYMEFSVIVNSETLSEEEKMKIIPNKKPHQNLSYKAFPVKIEESQFAYSYLKVMSKKGSGVEQSKNSSLFNEIVQKMVLYKTEEILKLLKSLALTNNRAVPALKALCDALVNRGYNYTDSECSNLLFSLAKLSFRHEDLIRLLVDHLKVKGLFESPKIVSSLLHSLSVLKHRDSELVEKMMKTYSVDLSNIDSSVDVLISLGILNCSPPAVDSIIKTLSDFEDTDYQLTRNYINFIWSCVLLNKHVSIPIKHIQKVVSKSFFEKLELNKGLHYGVHLKMLNIIAAVSLLPSVKETLGNRPLEQNFLCPPISQQKNSFLESVKDSLGYIFSKSVNLESLIDTKAGFYLDFQCTLDSKSSPLLVKKKESCKLGILLLNYHDFCSDGTLTGLTAFKVNILTQQGYKVMTVSHTDYPINTKLSEKILFLRNLINSTINENSNANAKPEKATEKV